MGDKIIDRIRSYDKDFDLDLLRSALGYVADSKETRVLETLKLLLPFSPGSETVFSLLLKDAYIDGGISKEALIDEFGEDVFNLVKGLRSLEEVKKVEGGSSSQLETKRKMFLAMGSDMRVIVIDLAERLCDMYDIDAIPKEMRREFAVDTLELYVPIAERLGIYGMKTELQDLAFRYTSPLHYQRLSKELKVLRASCHVSISLIQRQLEDFFRGKGIEAEVTGRMKSLYSIHKKLTRKGLHSVNDLYDIFAIRVILPIQFDNEGHQSFDGLYSVLGAIHTKWKPISRRFKDYVAVPKPNGYRSLHTVVLGLAPKDHEQPVEIQIRDQKMHRDSEYGIASHWLYKQSNTVEEEFIGQEWVKVLEKIRTDFSSDEEGLKEMEVNFFKDRIFVLTPGGEVKDLPLGATPIDFAYSIHTDVGNRCVLAKVDGRVVPLNYHLKNGEMAEIITKNNSAPKLQWLSYVKTGVARNRIKAWFSSFNREKNIKEGRRLLNIQLERLGQAKLDQNYSIFKDYLGKNLSFGDRETLVEEVGRGSQLAHEVIKKVFPYDRAVDVPKKPVDIAKSFDDESIEKKVLIGGESDLPIKMASCCKPNLGDRIVGYVTRGGKITVHKFSCNLLDNLNGERIVAAEWRDQSGKVVDYYILKLKVTVASRVGMMRDVSAVISDLGIHIEDVGVAPLKSGLTEMFFSLRFEAVDVIDTLFDRLEAVSGVLSVRKVIRR